MKYAQLITGLLIGTALGGSVVASTGSGVSGGSKEDIKAVVRETILEEPQLIMESVQKFQAKQQDDRKKATSEALKDPAFKMQVMDATNDAYAGPKNAKHVVIEYFDYNCPACKGMFETFDKLLKERKDVKIVFREFPIFGEVSEINSRIGLAIWNLYPDQYYEFHQRMMKAPGHAEQKVTYEVITAMGLDLEKIKQESKQKKYNDVVTANRETAEKLHVQGTPTLIIGDEFVPHGVSLEELKQKIGK